MVEELNAARLRAATLAAARKTFEAVQRDHPGETFYAFALYTHADGGYILPSSNTEEGLERVARRYAQEYRGPLAFYTASLRWSPADWDYHLVGDDYFSEVQSILDQGPDYYEIEGDAERERLIETLVIMSRGVLKELDGQGLFGRGKAREQVVVNLLMGDQSDEERLNWAKELNPEPAYRWFEATLRQGTDAFERLLGDQHSREDAEGGLS